ncbi:hypothetical protein VTI74DRAFT_6253 [Chaetomium olivicolor]
MWGFRFDSPNSQLGHLGAPNDGTELLDRSGSNEPRAIPSRGGVSRGNASRSGMFPGAPAEGESSRRAPFIREASSAGPARRRRPNAKEVGDNARHTSHQNDTPANPYADDPNVISWDEDDAENPYNWPAWKKSTNIGCVTFLVFLVCYNSSMPAGIMPQLAYTYGQDLMHVNLSVSSFTLGYLAGPLLMTPLSESCGRLPIYHITNLGSVCLTLACAFAPSLRALIALRFLAGVFGSCVFVNGPLTILDLVRKGQRKLAMGTFACAQLAGLGLGPVPSAYIGHVLDWAWAFHVVTVAIAAVSVMMLVLARETNARVLLHSRVERLRERTGNDALRSAFGSCLVLERQVQRNFLHLGKTLFSDWWCPVFALYWGIAFGYQYVALTGIAYDYPEYFRVPSSSMGYYFLGFGLGCFVWGPLWYRVVTVESLRFRIWGYLHEKSWRSWTKQEPRLWGWPLGCAMASCGFFIRGWLSTEEFPKALPWAADLWM